MGKGLVPKVQQEDKLTPVKLGRNEQHGACSQSIYESNIYLLLNKAQERPLNAKGLQSCNQLSTFFAEMPQFLATLVRAKCLTACRINSLMLSITSQSKNICCFWKQVFSTEVPSTTMFLF